jgi:hypothetical protein
MDLKSNKMGTVIAEIIYVFEIDGHEFQLSFVELHQ